MFDTLIAALDLDADVGRTLDVVQALVLGTSVGVDLVSVCDPARSGSAAATRLADLAGERGWPPAAARTVIHDVDVAGVLLDLVERRPGSLLVVGTAAHRVSVSSIEHSVAREVVRRADGPVVVVGPRAALDRTTRSTTLVACVDASDLAERSVPTIVRWQATFAGAPPEAVAVVTPGDDPKALQRRADAVVGRLAAAGVPAHGRLLHAVDPVAGLESVTSDFVNPVYVATSRRYPDGHLHLFSTTQRLVQEARCPVLVVPAQPGSRRAGERAYGATASSPRR